MSSTTVERLIYLTYAMGEREILKRLNRAIIDYTKDPTDENLVQLNGFLMMCGIKFSSLNEPIEKVIAQYKNAKFRHEFFNPNKN